MVRLGPEGGTAPPRCIAKWRNDRADDHEGLLCAQVLDAALLAPCLYARRSWRYLHVRLLEDTPASPAAPEDPGALTAALSALDRAPALSGVWRRHCGTGTTARRRCR